MEAGADGGPFGVGDGEPGGVPVLALHHHVVAEDAFEGEAEALGGAAGRLVAGVAAPLPAAVAEGGEGVVGQQERDLPAIRQLRLQMSRTLIPDLSLR